MPRKYEIIFWDFDGVLMNSNEIRDIGFELVLKEYPLLAVQKLLQYHRDNGGLSRYVKFRYFFEQILNQEVTELQIETLASSFSKIMVEKLINPDLLINDSIEFVKRNYCLYDMYIVSGSDQAELRFLCEKLEIHHYFKGIFGSPMPKNEIVKMLIDKLTKEKSKCILIGDSINDLEAAEKNEIDFIGYNSPYLKKFSKIYINQFGNLIDFE
jgi:phosphoglycolate phosphatase-like HAD superfamily hydrolase